MSATPTPWEYVPSTEHHGPYVVSPFGGDIADCYTMSRPDMPSTRNGGPSKPIHFMGDEADANAALIVKAVNACQPMLEALEFYADPDGDGYDVQVTNYGLSTEEGDIIRDRGERARAVIALAKGGAQ